MAGNDRSTNRCPPPFLDEALFSSSGGFLAGRNCAPNPLLRGEDAGRCCIPCPVYDYLYDDDFKALTDGAAWTNVAGFALCFFLLVSMLILPSKATRVSCLNIFLLVGIMLLELGFIVPLVAQPNQCYNGITPNDMYTNTTCAVSGAFAVFGLMGVVTWILVRALFMHLQICWDKTPGKYMNIIINVIAGAVTVALAAAELIYAGVSFRFGGYCHVNTTGSIVTYWSWLLGFGGVAFILQVATLGYCMKVYLQNAKYTGGPGVSSSGGSFAFTQSAGSIVASTATRSARAKARRIRQVVRLQWRSLAIVSLAIFTTAFVCIVFIVEDNRRQTEAFADTDTLIPWIKCMLETQNNEACLGLTEPIIIPEKVVVATLFILGATGIEAFGLLFRTDIFKAWRDLFTKPFKRTDSFECARPPPLRSVHLENRPGRGLVVSQKWMDENHPKDPFDTGV